MLQGPTTASPTTASPTTASPTTDDAAAQGKPVERGSGAGAASVVRPALPAGPGPMMHFADAAEWEAWLAEHHESGDGAWLMIAKKGADTASVTITQALEIALCYGWIDSHRKSHDEHFYLQRYSRRRKGGSWSRKNVERVEALTAAGRMRPPGLAEVAAAQADGRWAAAYTGQQDATVPPDLAAALAACPQAAARFEALDRTTRYLMILPLLKARTPAGRAARLQKAVSALLDQ